MTAGECPPFGGLQLFPCDNAGRRKLTAAQQTRDPARHDDDLVGAPGSSGSPAASRASSECPAEPGASSGSPVLPGASSSCPESAIPDAPEALRAQRHAENFPVALRVLPRSVRGHLTAIYDVARTIDELGDSAEGDRAALLREFSTDLARIWAGEQPRAPVLRRLAPTVAAARLNQRPLQDLVEANLVDQRVHRYASYAQLREYCALSAHPVGRLVLAVFGVTDPAAVELSDRVCAALQLIEHWQDVAEDRAAGRVYLPAEDLARFGVTEADLDAPTASPAVRRLMAFEIDRAAALLDSGAGLVDLLRGWARLAVAGYLAGGRAAVDGLRRVDGDVLGRPARTRRRDVLRHLVRLLASPKRRRAPGSPRRRRAPGTEEGSWR
jgi:squalene synthase HpnC